MFNRKTSLDMSNVKPKTMHGIEIKKMPVRAYMQFAEKGAALVPVFLDKLFPDMSTPEIAAKVMTLDRNGATKLVMDLIITAPQALCELFAELLGVEPARLMDDPNIGPTELWDIMEYWYNINNLQGFFGHASRLFHRP